MVNDASLLVSPDGPMVSAERFCRFRVPAAYHAGSTGVAVSRIAKTYFTVRLKFGLASTAAIAWMVFSIFAAEAWILDFSQVVGVVPAYLRT